MATELKDLKAIEKRTAQSWFEDGIWELASGGLSLWLGLYFFLLAVAPDKTTWKSALVKVGILPWFFLGGWLWKTAVRAMKQRLTYRRTGFVSYCRPDEKTRRRKALMAALSAMVVSFGMVYVVTHRPAAFDTVTILTGCGFALTMIVLAFRTGAVRLFLGAAAVAAAGTGLSFSGWSETLCLAIFYAVLAAVLWISGGIALALYLKRNPIVPEDRP